MKFKAILLAIILFIPVTVIANPFGAAFDWGSFVPVPDNPPVEVPPILVGEKDEEQHRIRLENAKKIFCEQIVKGRSIDGNCIKGNGIDNSTEYLGTKQFPKYTIKIHPEKYCVLKPRLKFDSVPIGQVDCFAAYSINQRLYIMLRDLDGVVGMHELHQTGAIVGYKAIDLNGENQWQCLAFEKRRFLPELLLEDGVTFYIAIAAKGDLTTIQGAAFIFEVDDD